VGHRTAGPARRGEGRGRGAGHAAGQVNALQEQQVAVLGGIGEGIRAAVIPEEQHKLGAMISLQLARTPQVLTTGDPKTDWLGGGNEEYLIVRNLGPGGAQVRDLHVVSGGPRFLIAKNESPIPGGVDDLLPGESFAVQLAPRVFGDPWELEVSVSWLDGSGEHERVRTLTPAP
jgi:hypothetical protein